MESKNNVQNRSSQKRWQSTNLGAGDKLSTKTTNISNELCRLKEQIKEEYYNDIQDTEN